MTIQEIQALKQANSEMSAEQREALKAAACEGIKNADRYRTRERKTGVQRFYEQRDYTVLKFDKGNKNGKSKFNWVDVILQDNKGRLITISATALLYKRVHGSDTEGGIVDLPEAGNVDQLMDWVLDNAGTTLRCTLAQKVTPDAVWNEELTRDNGEAGDWDTSKKGSPTWVYAFKVK